MGRCREWCNAGELAARPRRGTSPPPRVVFDRATLGALLCNRLSLGRVARWRGTLKMSRSLGRSLPVRRLEAGVPGRALP